MLDKIKTKIQDPKFQEDAKRIAKGIAVTVAVSVVVHMVTPSTTEVKPVNRALNTINGKLNPNGNYTLRPTETVEFETGEVGVQYTSY